jgi:hypothetical protein
MPVYEIIMQQPNGNDRVRYGEHLPAEIGDALTIDGNPGSYREQIDRFVRREVAAYGPLCRSRDDATPVPGREGASVWFRPY